MATRAVQQVVEYKAWDVINQTGKTGDVANHTLRWIKDGVASAPTNAPSEVDAANLPGEYKLTLTAAETDCLFGTLGGKSSTANIEIIPTRAGFEYVPNAAAGANGGLPTVDASNAVKVQSGSGANQINLNAGNVALQADQGVNATKVGGTAQTGRDLGAQLDAAVSTRLAANAYTAPDNASITAVKAKTDNLPPDPADASDIAAAFTTVNSALATIAGYIDTEVAAIKAKTDNLPVDPADASDIAASFVTVSATLATIASYLDTEVAAIKARTDNLPVDPADASDIAASFVTVSATLATIAGYLDTEVAAIKAKTDNLPTDPADASDIAAAITSVSGAVATVDGHVLAVKAKTDALPASPAAAGDVPSAIQNADALLDRANAIETGMTLRAALRLISAVLAGTIPDADTGTNTFNAAVADHKPRVIVTVDSKGNRSNIEVDLG